jgi:hypothetical protein
MAIRVKGWETSMTKQGPQGWVRTNVWVCESDIADEDPANIISAVFGTTEPGKLTWVWGDQNQHTDQEIILQNISCRVRNRDQSRKIWVVQATYVDIRAQMATGRNRDAQRVGFPQ